LVSVISDLIRPVWTWVLWSWRRLAITACVICVLLGAATRAVRAPVGQPHQNTHQAAPPRRPDPVSALSGAALAAAVRTGREFATAWVSPQRGWARQVRQYANRGLTAQVTAGDHAYLPATAITGPPTVIGETAASVVISVPTNAGPAVVTVVRSGTGWLAAAVHLTRVGD
jgi:hypothetical protein